ncbi:hypothetical protein H5410_006074 [Solanum commersonii]|uniref:Uncharacterized protein n=1 Tax=Solanum commersonii TaxID=4109 RepID=A0A9J6A8V9_SOLCO|nr:hypothetical protein H5410_006074 [Solanum commersonii]
MCCEGPCGEVSRDRRYIRRSFIGRYGTVSRNCLTTCRLLHYIANLTFSFRAQRTGTKGNLQADRRVAN